MASNSLPDPPTQLKAIQCYMKIASDIERLDPVVSYWVRLYSTETALSIDKDSPECKTFLGALILWLEKFKQTHKDNEAVSNQTVGQAHYENFVIRLFAKADTLDREGTANKNTIRMFYMAACLFESMAVFGALNEDLQSKAKYAKFKAAYIQKCLKTGQVPKPGPIESSDLEDPSNSENQASNEDPFATTSTPDNKPQNVPEPSTGKTEELPKPSDPFIMTPSSGPVFPPAMPSHYSQLPSQPSTTKPTPSSVEQPAGTGVSTSSNKSSINATKFQATNGTPLNAEDLIKSQKYCKFANSALQYDDIPTAVANLEKALKILKTGEHLD